MCTGTNELSGSWAASGKITTVTTGVGAATGAADEDSAGSAGASEGDGGGDGGGVKEETTVGEK